MGRPPSGAYGGRRWVAWLFWTGLALAPVAALMLLLGQGVGPLRIAAVLAVSSTVLIGLSVTFRQDLNVVSDGISKEIEDGLAVVHRELDMLRGSLDAAVRRESDRVREELRRELILRGESGSAAAGYASPSGYASSPATGVSGVAAPVGPVASAPARSVSAQGISAQGVSAQGVSAQGVSAQGVSAQGFSAGVSAADVDAAAARKAVSQQWSAPAWDSESPGASDQPEQPAAQTWSPPAWESSPAGSPYSSDPSDRTGRFSPSPEASGSSAAPRTSWAFDPPNVNRSGSFPAFGQSASSRPGTGSYPTVSSPAGPTRASEAAAGQSRPDTGSFPTVSAAARPFPPAGQLPSRRSGTGSFPQIPSRPSTGSFPPVSSTPSRPGTGSFPTVGSTPSRPGTGSFPTVGSTPSRPGTGSYPTVGGDPSGSFAAAGRDPSGSFAAVPPGGPIRRRRAADGNDEEPDVTGDLTRQAGLPAGTMYNPQYGSGHDPLAPPPPPKGRGRKDEPADPYADLDPNQWPPESTGRYRPRHGG